MLMIERVRYNGKNRTNIGRDKRYCGLRVLLKTGNIYSTEFCYHEVPLKHDVFDFDTFVMLLIHRLEDSSLSDYSL